MRILVTTTPFGQADPTTIDLLEKSGCDYSLNPFGRRLQPGELQGLIENVDILIAGTEKIDSGVFDRANRLKLISRVGIGLDGIDLQYAKSRGIRVSYTPDAPAPAVAELTLGLMLALVRGTHVANSNMQNGIWQRHFGLRLANLTIGIVGCGRIGTKVVRHLSSFKPKQILCNDLRPDSFNEIVKFDGVKPAAKQEIYSKADLISLHVPLTATTHSMITKEEIKQMKEGVFLINTSRGGIIHEADLAEALKSGAVSGAAIDTFTEEPYTGELNEISSCLTTCHMGSMTVDCRAAMEKEAVEEAVRFLNGEPLHGSVPPSEFEAQSFLG